MKLEPPLRWDRCGSLHTCEARLPVRCGCGDGWLKVSAQVSEDAFEFARVDVAVTIEVELTQQLARALLERCPDCGCSRRLLSSREGGTVGTG